LSLEIPFRYLSIDSILFHSILFPREDYELAMNLTSEAQKNQLYNNLKATAESGWDFTSRYFNKDGTDNGKLIFFLNICNKNLLNLMQ
jgi:Neutral trehalase